MLRTEDRVMGVDQWTKGLKILSGGIAQNHSRQVDGVRGKETHDYITVSHRCLYSFEGQAGGWRSGKRPSNQWAYKLCP